MLSRSKDYGKPSIGHVAYYIVRAKVISAPLTSIIFPIIVIIGIESIRESELSFANGSTKKP